MVTAKVHSVLIVEDERIVAKDLQQTLAGMGYDAFAIASSGDEALQRVSERCPDLVLMDIRIKGERDGIETAALLREHFGVPVVYLTAHADEVTIARAKATEPYGYLMKPVRMTELRSTIDVTVYKYDMEKRQRARERCCSTTLRSMADAVVAVDLAGNVTFMNRAAETLTGVTAEHAIGQSVRDIVAAASASRILCDSESPVIDDGQVLGAVMVFRDVTDQRLLQAQVDLTDRFASLSTMAAGIASELNSPLAVVIAHASSMLDELRYLESTGADPRALAEAMHSHSELDSAAQRIARTVIDLQAFAQPMQAPGGEADVRSAVDWAVRATADELEACTRVAIRIAPVRRVMLDQAQLIQILVNVLENAAQAIAPGHAEVNAVEIVASALGDSVVIEVRDTGCGMPPAVAQHIFEPFYTTRPGSAGLGLAICHGIVRSVGGRIEVESRVGEGTTFRITLPVAIRRAANADVAPVPMVPEQRGRILVVDDEPMLLKAVKRMLSAHEVVCVEDAREVVARLAAGDQFDVILCDVLMPRMTGIELYERLLADDPEAARRMVFLSGGAVDVRASDFLTSVPNVCVDKPVSANALRALIQQRLTRS